MQVDMLDKKDWMEIYSVIFKNVNDFYLSYLMRFLALFVNWPKKVSSSLGNSDMTLAAVVESNEFWKVKHNKIIIQIKSCFWVKLILPLCKEQFHWYFHDADQFPIWQTVD